MSDTITVRFLGEERVFDLAALVGHYRLFIGDLLFEIGAGNQVVWFASFANLTEFAETPQEAASKLETSLMPLALVLEPLTREPSKSLLHELFPDLDKEDEIEIPDCPLPEGLFASEEDE